MKQILKDRLYLDIDDIEYIIYVFDSTGVFFWGNNKKVVCIFSALKGNLNIHKYLNIKFIKKLYEEDSSSTPRGYKTEMLSINFLIIYPEDPNCYEKIKHIINLTRGDLEFEMSSNLDEKIKNFIKRTT